MTKIKAVIFDLDNTLIDFWKMKNVACEAALRAMIKKGLKAPFKSSHKKLMETYLRTGLDSDTAFSEFLKEQAGQVDTRMLAAGINAYLKTKSKFLKPYPNVASTLKKLKQRGLKLVIVTDAPRLKGHQRLDSIGVDSYFDHVVGFEDTGEHKPSKLPFRAAVQKLGLKPEEILMVGDSIHRDIAPAKKIGMTSALAKYGRIEKEKGKADFELNDIAEILKIV
jgi:putative hydrolase of the HAD superfamily